MSDGAVAGLRCRVARVRSRQFRQRWPEPAEGHAPTSLELLEEYGLPLELSQLDSWEGHSYVRMARGCADLYEELIGVGLIAISYATPELMVPEIVGCYLAQQLGGNPELLGVSDQSGGAGVTAMDLSAALMTTDAIGLGLLVALDQQTPYHAPAAGHVPAANVFVTIELSLDEGLSLVETDVRDATDPGAALRSLIGVDDAVYVGHTLAQDCGESTCGEEGWTVGPPGICTSAWRALESAWPTTGTVVVADYDPHGARLYSARLHAPLELAA